MIKTKIFRLIEAMFDWMAWIEHHIECTRCSVFIRDSSSFHCQEIERLIIWDLTASLL